ncbi:MAG: hypothetical protein WCA46_09145 [Actinocatenispora sp.]
MSLPADLLLMQAHEHQQDMIGEAQQARLLSSARKVNRRSVGRHTRKSRSAGTVVPCGQAGAASAR